MTDLREHLRGAAARVLADGPVPVTRLAKKVPADRGGRAHASAGALVRWITKGRGGVRLDGARLAGKGWCSSEAALARFAAELALREIGEEVVSPPCERERRAAAALAALDALRAGRAGRAGRADRSADTGPTPQKSAHKPRENA